MNNNLNPNIDADNSGNNMNDMGEDINSQSEQDAVPDIEPADPQLQNDADNFDGQNDDNNNDDGEKPKKKLSDYSLSKMAKGIKDWWNESSPTMKKFVIGSIIAFIVLVVFVVIILNTDSNVVAFSGLETQEAAEIMTILKANKIYYDYNSALGTISVREKDSANIIMALAQDGYPKTGYAWSPTQSTGLFQTDADKLREEKENLRKLLETAIETLDGVESSLVIPYIPDNRNNLLTGEQEVSSVTATIHMKPGEKLSAKAIAGIETLLLRSIPGIKLENISIHDSSGALLNVPEEEDVSKKAETLYELKKRAEREYEDILASKAIHSVDPFYGEEGVRVSAKVTFNFDKWIEDALRYDGANVNEETGEVMGILAGNAGDRSVGHTTDSSVVGGETGTPLNIDDPGDYETSLDTEEGYYYDDAHYANEYLVDVISKKLEHETPEISEISLSVSINTQELDSDVEERIIGIVATGTGISSIALKALSSQDNAVLDTEVLRNYITVMGMPFFTPDDLLTDSDSTGFFTFQNMLILGIILLLLLAVILIVIIILRRNRRQAQAQTEEEAEEAGILVSGEEEMSDADLDELIGAVARSDTDTGEERKEPVIPPESLERILKGKILAFTEQNIEITAQLIKTMLKEEVPPNG